MSINMCLCAQEVTDHTLSWICLLGTADRKHYESRRIVAKWGTTVLGPTGTQWQPPWRPRVGPKLPLSALRAKAFGYSPLPCCFPRSWMGQCCSPSPKRNKRTNERAVPKKACFSPSASQQITLGSSDRVVHHSAQLSLFIFRLLIIPSIVISLPLRHPVSVSLQIEEFSTKIRATWRKNQWSVAFLEW